MNIDNENERNQGMSLPYTVQSSDVEPKQPAAASTTATESFVGRAATRFSASSWLSPSSSVMDSSVFEDEVPSSSFKLPNSRTNSARAGSRGSRGGSGRDRNSLELRKAPVPRLLLPGVGIGGRSRSSSKLLGAIREESKGAGHQKKKFRKGFLRRTCLNSKHSIRQQMMLTFGFVYASTILFIMVACIVVCLLCGDIAKTITKDSFENSIMEIEGTTARYLAEDLTPHLIPDDLVRIISEATRERFLGYPNHLGYAEDTLVPFRDTESNTNKYPIVGEPLPLDWQIKPNVNNQNYMEHVQNRWGWNNRSISTSTASYYMQGMCDPSVTDIAARTYYPNCNNQNNNVSVGGIVAPTPTNHLIHRKASDLTPILKALYEYHQSVRSLGVYFANGGSGAVVQFPHFELDTNMYYESIGCDWLMTTHPFNRSRPIFANSDWQEQIKYETICRPAGQIVSSRLYNAMERFWCRDQATDPHKIKVAGPYPEVFHGGNLITVGQAIYDKVTSEFIGCVAVDYVLDSFQETLHNSLLLESGKVTIVRYDPVGTVVATTAQNMTSMTSIVTIDMIDSGVTAGIYQSLWSLVNYTNIAMSDWNETEIRDAYEDFVYDDVENGYQVHGYPIPPPPKHFSPHYVPEFMAIMAVPTPELYEGVEQRLGEIDHAMFHFIVLSVGLGSGGLFWVVVFITFVSLYLTGPVRYMNEVATEIFNKNFGDDDYDTGEATTIEKWEDDGDNSGTNDDSGIHATAANKTKAATATINRKIKKRKKKILRSFKKLKFTPNTELHEVVIQFEKMVSNFAGASMAKSVQTKDVETKNEFPMITYSEFKNLYLSRRQSAEEEEKEEEKSTATRRTRFEYDFNDNKNTDASSFGRVHMGTNIHHHDALGNSRRSSAETSDTTGNSKKDGVKNKGGLFFWIVVLMVVPFMITTVTTAGIIIHKAQQDFVVVLHDTKNLFVHIEKKALNIYARHRAHLISGLMERPIRDLHLLTRYTGWLLFDGVQRVDSFTEVVSNAEACKTYPDFEQCHEFVQSQVCDCAWHDKRGTCHNYTEEGNQDSRSLQKLMFISQSQDTWSNGDRNSTSYPDVSFSPETTAWWDNISSLPGAEVGSQASGYSTTYSRIRVLSALPISQLLYNKESHNRVHLASFIGFEADGTLMGYEGCAFPGHEVASQVVSSKVSARLRPNICPDGKYGFDPRCREWYNIGKEQYEKNNSHLYVTPPYDFAGDVTFGQTCTSPLTDPTTGEYIGQAFVDFLVTPLLESLSDRQTPLSGGGFPLLIASSSEYFYEDTFLGSRFELINPQPVTDVVFADDPECFGKIYCDGRAAFQDIVDKMKSGGGGFDEFRRKKADGSFENVYIAFAPVHVKSFSPLNNSDFSRGVEASEVLIYSLALAETELGLLGDFFYVQNALVLRASVGLALIVMVLATSSVLVIYISYRVASSITDPMLYLLELIQQINRLDCYGNAPEFEMDRRGHSLEVANVSKTMESLYLVIRSANVAFFEGDLENAYTSLQDVLGVYRGLDNKKGISIACNNLGNIMLTMYRAMKAGGEEVCCGFTKREIVAKGVGYFHETIQVGEKAYDNFYEMQGWSPSCLEFMQNLSNRYFNRAIFLLTVKEIHSNPKEIEELGERDLTIARDMDLEIVEEGSQAGWGVRTLDTLFVVTLTRLRGHILLLEMGYPDEWEVDEKLEEAFQTVKKEMTKPSSILFKDINPAGRMQQVETELMRYKLLKGDVLTAARIAIRMLVEDEYILEDAHTKAVEVLLSFVNSSLCKFDEVRVQRIKAQLLNYQSYINHSIEMNAFHSEEVTAAKPEGFARQKSVSSVKTDSVRSSSKFRNSRYESRRGDFTMETF